MNESLNHNIITIDTCSMIGLWYSVQYLENYDSISNIGNIICDIIKTKIPNPKIVTTEMAMKEFGYAPYKDIK